jgi:hypothetical protein
LHCLLSSSTSFWSFMDFWDKSRDLHYFERV